jgi:uncharacterized membrane protein YkvA (DUF1232 family)
MLNLSPIGHEHALTHARDEADQLLQDPRGRLETLLADVEQLRQQHHAELEAVNPMLRGMIAAVRKWQATGGKCTSAVRGVVAALAYLRNPYDRIFDLHVEGGFADDVIVLTRAWTAMG